MGTDRFNYKCTWETIGVNRDILLALVLVWINSHSKDNNQCIGFAYRFQVPTTETAIDISVSQINKCSKDKKMADFNQAAFLISLLWLTLDTL